MRNFRKVRDDRFALTTLQNPLCEVRTYAELVQAAQRERENQPGAAQIAATPAPAAPDAPDPVPAPQIAATEESTPADSLPADLAPLDSAGPEPASPGSLNEDAQQPDASLAAPVATSAASLDNDTTEQSTPQPARKAKAKPRPRSKPRRSTSPSGENQELGQHEPHEPTPLERHARKCSICSHPQREYIEEAFLQWRSPDTIMHSWGVQSRTTIYHHAHACNLFAQRNRNLQFASGGIIEYADTRHFTAREILDAVRTLAHLNEEGRWVHPSSKSEVMFSTRHLPAYPNAAPILIATAPELKNDVNH
jgi:hypothetical protein